MNMIPHSPEAEKAFLSSAIQNISLFDIHADSLKESLFFSRQNKCIFRALIALWKESSAVDLVTVGQWLEEKKLIDEAGGHAYLTEVAIYVPTHHNHGEYINILRDKHIARLAIASAERIIGSAQDPASSGDLSEVVQKALVAIAGEAESSAHIESIKDVGTKRLEYYEQIAKSDGKLLGITTGLNGLDRITGGMKQGQLIVLGAPTKGGKTSLCMNICLRAADANHPVGIFSLEMTGGELFDRLVAAHASVDMSVLANKPTPSDCGRVGFALQQIQKLPIWIRDESQINPLQLRAAARRMVAMHQVKLIVVDYIQLIDPTDRKDSRERQVADVSRTLKQLAKELGVTILALTQLNADGFARESRAIEHDCDSFWVIRYDEQEKKWSLDIRLARSHPRGSIPLEFRSQYLRFDEA
jgi:replicative DNA helicase